MQLTDFSPLKTDTNFLQIQSGSELLVLNSNSTFTCLVISLISLYVGGKNSRHERVEL